MWPTGCAIVFCILVYNNKISKGDKVLDFVSSQFNIFERNAKEWHGYIGMFVQRSWKIENYITEKQQLPWLAKFFHNLARRKFAVAFTKHRAYNFGRFQKPARHAILWRKPKGNHIFSWLHRTGQTIRDTEGLFAKHFL